MKKALIALCAILIAIGVQATPSYAQGAAKTGPDPSTVRDEDLEKDSLHNLEVARHYFKLKKAYVAAIKRCEEIDAGNPNFNPSNVSPALAFDQRGVGFDRVLYDRIDIGATEAVNRLFGIADDEEVGIFTVLQREPIH